MFGHGHGSRRIWYGKWVSQGEHAIAGNARVHRSHLTQAPNSCFGPHQLLDGVRLCSWHMTAYSATTLVATVALGALLGALQPRVGAALMTGFVALCTYGAVQPALLLILGGLLAQTLSSPTVRAPPAPSNAHCPRC